MKPFLMVIFLLNIFNISSAQIYDKSNVELLGHWDGSNASVGTGIGNRYSSCYGYTQNEKHYAIIGSADRTYFIDISNPEMPVLIDSLNGGLPSSIWREYKTYSHYAYMVSDDGGLNKFQIVDLQYLPDSIHVVHNGNTYFSRAHTVYIEGSYLYTASTTSGTGFSEMTVWSLANPEMPVKIRELQDDYPTLVAHIHDMFVVNDTIYASGGDDKLHILRLTGSPLHFELLGSMTSYTDAGYNHSTTLLEDGKTLIMADEVPTNLRMKSVDVSDFSDLQEKDVFSPVYGATPHNPYTAHINNRIFVASYHDGINVFDCSDPANISLTGYFDTHHQSVGSDIGATGNYNGCWGAYIFPDSKWIIASDMTNGLFILDASVALGLSTGIVENTQEIFDISTFPNPVNNVLNLNVNNFNFENDCTIQIYNLAGQNVYTSSQFLAKGINRLNIEVKDWVKGLYQVKVSSSSKSQTISFIKD